MTVSGMTRLFDDAHEFMLLKTKIYNNQYYVHILAYAFNDNSKIFLYQ